MRHITKERKTGMEKGHMDYQEILKMEPKSLMNWLVENFKTEIPIQLDTVQDMETAGRLLGKLTNQYAYLVSLATYAKLAVREEKRKGASNKVASDNMIDRRDAIQNMADIIKMQYQAVSRMITVKKEINAELHMSDIG